MVLIRHRTTTMHLGKKGDTIVEVLISLAIISVVLVSAYALTSKNTASSQEVQEQSTALKLLEKQAELLLAADSPIINPGCFNQDGGYVELPTITCTMTETGAEYDDALDSGAKYTVGITSALNGSTRTYTLTANWVTLSNTTANISMYTRRAD